MKVDFFRHNITSAERKALDKTLRGLFISTGDEVATFETKFANYTAAPYAVGVTSATAGLHLALESLGIGRGDEVITSPMSFIATSNSILHAGATPKFVDVEPDTGNIDVANIEKAITKKTKAIMPVHLYGQLCDMKSISAIAKSAKLRIIEDAAHAVEATRDGIKVGQLSDAAAFSFYATKNMTSGEGGAITVRSKRVRNILRQSRSHGMTKDAASRYQKKFQHYDMKFCGWKYNMSNIQAALLLPQLERVEKNLRLRQKAWDVYLKHLSDVPKIGLPKIVAGSRSALHLFTVWVSPKKRNSILTELESAGIGVAINFRPIHLMSFYRKRFGFRKGDFPVAENIGNKVITLPLYPTLKPGQIKYVCDTLKSLLG
ncbi:MAG TPA: DegT/DnrJ/EryC1/StrS family aminotransferase [Nitrospinota bacterium]|nr:DegT/DnrJ/EryC1/StrS family aminotransferase [Nitrospinota bacterium]|tara:strand:+ start:100374 stop:101498 length:1125 start_codon:yes stop_codon:yes gene_type:complete